MDKIDHQPKTRFASQLTRDVKYKLAEDYGIGYDSREAYIRDQTDDQLMQILLGNMERGDRSRAVLDFLLDIENRQRTDELLDENKRLSKATVVLAIATVVLALATIALAVATFLMLQKMH